MPLRARLYVAALALLLSVAAGRATAQPASQPGGAVGPAEATIQLNFPERVPLETLVAFVIERLDVNILYEQSQLNQRITLKTPAPIPRAGLVDLLRTVLKTKNLVLEPTDTPGLLKITPAQGLAGTARLEDAGAGGEGKTAVTRVFVVEHIGVQRVANAVRPFLSQPGGALSAMPDEQLLVVSDYRSNVRQIADLVARLDTARSRLELASIRLEHAEAQQVASAMQPMLQARSREALAGPAAEAVAVQAAGESHLLVIAPPRVIEQVRPLIRKLDQPARRTRKTYEPSALSVRRFDEIVRDLFVTGDDAAARARYRSVVQAETGMLVVLAPPVLHERIEALLKDIDLPAEKRQRRFRFYKLENRIADEVLTTIRSLHKQGVAPQPDANAVAPNGQADQPTDPGGDDIPAFSERLGRPPPDQAGADQPDPAQAEANRPPLSGTGTSTGDGDARSATVVADRATNSLIVVGPPAVQASYQALIERLDQRRPQVLIETTIVSLDTSDGFELGVEIGRQSSLNGGDLITFSSFGISGVDPATGSLSPRVTPGGNLALLDPDIADVVLRALSTHRRSRLVSMPRVLVNDNQTGSLTSQNVQPFEQTVVGDAATIIAQGDEAKAGTTIEVTPHISADDYLQLAYDIELSSFTGMRQDNLPPPRQENTVQSEVTIPDGHTIVVGGLNRTQITNQVDALPILGRLPLIKHLFRSQDDESVNRTLFVFIQPTILRDERFADLKRISSQSRDEAEVSGDYPASAPLMLSPEQ